MVTVYFYSIPYKADDGNRTRDLLTTNEVRYRLCHISIVIILPHIFLKIKCFFYFFQKLRISGANAPGELRSSGKSECREWDCE